MLLIIQIEYGDYDYIMNRLWKERKFVVKKLSFPLFKSLNKQTFG